jgi:hypothetical protein
VGKEVIGNCGDEKTIQSNYGKGDERMVGQEPS